MFSSGVALRILCCQQYTFHVVVTEVSLLLGAQNFANTKIKVVEIPCHNLHFSFFAGTTWRRFLRFGSFFWCSLWRRSSGQFLPMVGFPWFIGLESRRSGEEAQNTIPFEPFILTISMFLHGREQSPWCYFWHPGPQRSLAQFMLKNAW